MANFHPPFLLTSEVAIDDPEKNEWTLKYFAGSPRDWIVLDKITVNKFMIATDVMELIAEQIHNRSHN